MKIRNKTAGEAISIRRIFGYNVGVRLSFDKAVNPMRCPKCGNDQCQIITTTNTESHTQGYGFGKGCCGYIVFGPIGWLCGLCGMGKGRTISTTAMYWVCPHCGKKFRA